MARCTTSAECGWSARLRSRLIAIGAPQPPLANALVHQVRAVSARPWLVLLLLLACFAPRCWMALELPAICPDAVVYFRAAEAFERGDVRAALSDMKLNTFPLVLAGLHRLGMTYEQAGVSWGLMLSSAAVLPLWGWVRRQFDDRVALVACMLYAAQPGLIERSPEIIREPTFWFLFMLGLYASWRAVAERRIGMYLLAGCCLLLAVLTRFEGALLAIPLVGWTIVASLQGTGRARLWWGLAASLAVGPVLLIGLQWIAFPSAEVESLVRIDPLGRVQAWLTSWNAADELAPAVELTGTRRIGAGVWPLVREFLLVVGRGLEPIYVLLLVASFVGWTRLWLRRDMLPLLLVAGSVLLATWIHLWFAREGSSRYVLTAWLVLSPLAALGLLWPQERRALLPNKLAANALAQGALAVVLVSAIAIYGITDAVTSKFEARSAEAQLGRWISRHYGHGHPLAGSLRASSLVAYYAGSRLQELPCSLSDTQFADLMAQLRPEVFLVDLQDVELSQLLEAHGQSWGFEEIDARFLPVSYSGGSRLFIKSSDRALYEPTAMTPTRPAN